MLRALLLFTLAATSSFAQWQMQDSHSTAGFRGIHAVNAQVAWASGTNGTILRTENGGADWTKCAIPPDADKLDFRAIWAWDASNAVVMSAGPGELSRLYTTTDGCAHWTEYERNHDKDGFWDALVFSTIGDSHTGVLIGDPIRGRFDTATVTLGKGLQPEDSACAAAPGEAAFAASNSSVVVFGPGRYVLGTGGKGGPRALLSPGCRAVSVPLAGGNESSGIFSLAFRDLKHGLAVGGDYKKPGESSGTSAWTADGGLHWTAASRPPHGYRSSVAWDADAKAWIAACTNGSDISRDDGRTWQPLDDGNWNALSLPFIVGPNGRIGKLTLKK
jgi:photosystem II stability/assembly factor-like uncharacterized protein